MLLVNSWDEALATLRPEAAQAPAPAEATIGDFLTELKAKADLKAGTLEGYAKALRKIVSDVFELGDGNDKCDYWAGGYQAWLAKVHAVRLADLTPERVPESGFYWLLGLAVGDGVAVGAGVTLKVSRRIFQVSPSRTKILD